MINLKTVLRTRLLACCLGLVIPVFANADDTEIYFAQATADNSENRVVANVMIMLDTSGSMRFCKDDPNASGYGYDAPWCSDADERRINLLQDALDELLDSVSPSVRIGIGRFNYSISSSGTGTGQQGGRILVPVTELNASTKALIRSQISTLNDAGEGTGDGLPARAQPVGDTPTARAYSEAARYMMGMTPNYGEDVGQDSVCALEEEVETNCRDEVIYGDAYPVSECNMSSNEYLCERGDWQDLPDWEVCDLRDSSNCRTKSGNYSNSWTDWSPDHFCNRQQSWCERKGPSGRREYRQRIFQTKQYLRRDPTGETQRVCDREMQCTQPLTIVENGRYATPINSANQCESNHIILFTDGAPSSTDKPGSLGFVNCDGESSYSCQRRIARYLNDPTNPMSRPVYTHNIGLYMGDNESSMRSVSEAGAGQTSNADSADELVQAFLSNLDLIDEQAKSISAPGVAVNTMNRFQHLDQLYYSVFQPFESSYWEGNLKRYSLVDGEIHGANGAAIDSDTGYFSQGSRSVWSGVVDGPDVTKGGAREHVGTRKLFYTDADGDLERLVWSSAPDNTFFGLGANATSAQRSALLKELGTMWGDPLHSVPVMVNYGESADNNHVFVSTNGGMLHAIDTETGEESFAFMPYEIISQAPRYTVNRPSLREDNTRQTYGLDGSWVAWRQGGRNSLDAPEAVYLYGGMRRGGRNYYALDVTDPTDPEMLWQVSNGSEDLAGLGQTWSTPTLTSVPDGSGSAVPILVIGGGYSPEDHDNGAARSDGDQMGNMVYFLNAESGEVVWSAGGRDDAIETVNAMKWAVPSSIAVVDIDFDGIADHMYFGDLGGQVFRISIKNDGNHVVDRIASLGGSSGNTRRRFYEAPAVGLVNANTGNELYVVIGSGYRAHPLDETATDGVFVIRDRTALNSGVSQSLATTANLTNVTAGGLPLSSDRGWFYTFSESGEKALASPVIFNGRILFTTYAPTANDESDNVCAVRFGASYLHTINLMTARPAALSDDLPAPTSRSQKLDQSTPAPTPTLLVDDEGRVITIVGTEVVGAGDLGDPRLRKRRWMQLPPDEANTIREEHSVQDTEGGE